MVPEKEVRIVLPYSGNMKNIIKTKLTKFVTKQLKHCKLKVLFKATCKLQNCFHF